MRATGHLYPLLSPDEVECIYRNVLRILREIGMQIQHDGLLRVLADFGLPVDFNEQRVRFPAAQVERFLAQAQPYDWENAEPQVGGSAGVYHGRFHDPETGQLVPWTEDSLAYYFALARSLPMIGQALMLGSRLPCAAALEPLYERYYCWKYGAHEGSSIFLDETCPALYDLYQVRAGQLGQSIQQVFQATVYLVPALKLGTHEAYQVAYFRERGLHVSIGDMYAMGGNAPVTLAGAVTLNLAEQIALRILDWAWFGTCRLRIGGSLSIMDMRTTIYPYGRPEMALANLMTAQMARFYRAEYHSHAGLSDAKLPSVEAGYQKALTALPTLLACGSLWMDAGLLSTDEVCSPIQLVLDNEFLSALQHMARTFPVDDQAIGFETIQAAGPGGHYLDKEHTVHYLRGSHWQPGLWTREMLHPWLESGARLDIDKAREIALRVRASDYRAPWASPEHEREWLRIIARASTALDI